MASRVQCVFEVLSPHNYSALVLPHERQSVSRAERRGVLQALQLRRSGERMKIVLDSEYVSKGIIEWSPKWMRHGWRTASGEVGTETSGTLGNHLAITGAGG